MDSRQRPLQVTLEFVGFLAETQVPTLIALTKVDKLRARDREAGIRGGLARHLSVSEDQVVASSARTGEGTEELLGAMAALLAVSG